MKTKDGFIQGYNAQAAVDAMAQSDRRPRPRREAERSNQLARSPTPSKPIWARSRRNCRRTRLIARRQPCGDGGTRDRRLYRAGRAKHAGKEKPTRRVAAMRERIKAGGHSSPYRLRKQPPEPVFGQIKQARGFRQFLLRGVEKVANEWGLGRLAHNILKPAQGRIRPWPHSQPAKLGHLGNGATNDGRKASTQPYIKPDARICCIRLSDWLERFKSHLAED